MAGEVALHLLEVRARELGNAEARSTLRLCHRQRELDLTECPRDSPGIPGSPRRSNPAAKRYPPAFRRQQASSCQNLAASLSAHLAAENKAVPD